MRPSRRCGCSLTKSCPLSRSNGSTNDQQTRTNGYDERRTQSTTHTGDRHQRQPNAGQHAGRSRQSLRTRRPGDQGHPARLAADRVRGRGRQGSRRTEGPWSLVGAAATQATLQRRRHCNVRIDPTAPAPTPRPTQIAGRHVRTQRPTSICGVRLPPCEDAAQPMGPAAFGWCTRRGRSEAALLGGSTT